MAWNPANLRTGTKLILAFSVLIAASVALMVSANSSLQQIQQRNQLLYQTQFKQLDDIKDIRISINRIRADTLLLFLSQDNKLKLATVATIKQRVAQGDETLARVQGRSVGDTKVAPLVQEVGRIWTEIKKEREKELDAVVEGHETKHHPLVDAAFIDRLERFAVLASAAESIMRLGEQSQAIGEIVASVNDLAEQSNLLGVNASIEAVKAGEAGKGFSVVAQEVKTLAEQSKQATAQVRVILGDIQKAMTKAVLVAEQGSKAVEAGYERARTSGDAIRLLTDNVETSGEVALQIAAASQQQMVGMDQIATAMANIRQASQDNVAGSRQVDQAARNLHQLGLKLKALAMQFKL